jgi:clan AA aspartic protease (TIGR02281 family)
MKLPALILLAALAAQDASADTVYLANGNQMKGVVVSRSKTEIVLDIGYGTVTLNAVDVVKVVPGAREADNGDLRQRRFDSGEKVPAGAASLAALYREASTRREKAIDTKEQDKTLDDERAAIAARLPESKQRFREDAANLAELSPNVDARAYNNAVTELNSTGAGIQTDQMRLEQIEEQRRALAGETHRYLEAWRALEAALKSADARALAWGNADQKAYAAWIKKAAAAMAADFRSDTVPSETRGDRVIVKVLINGKTTGRFLVDTGASTTVLYRGISERLALGPDAAIGRAKSRVADGRTIDGEIVRLDSLQVGRSRVDGSIAVVVTVDHPDFDGLLGVSFLGRFVTRVDATNGRLILEDLK